jgi:hypothetical protein
MDGWLPVNYCTVDNVKGVLQVSEDKWAVNSPNASPALVLWWIDSCLVRLSAHYGKQRFLMDFGNNKQVTIGNFPSFSNIFKKTIITMVFFCFFLGCVTATCSQRNKLLSRKEHGLFPETLYTAVYTNLRATVLY